MGLLTIDEAAEIAEISPYTLRRWIKRGVLPVIRVPQSNYQRVRRADLDALLSPSPPGKPTEAKRKTA